MADVPDAAIGGAPGRAEEAARASEARRAAIFEASLDAIITIDQAGTVLEFNPAAERCFGIARDDALGQWLLKLIIPERFHEVYERAFESYAQTGTGDAAAASASTSRYDMAGFTITTSAPSSTSSSTSRRPSRRLPGSSW